MIKLEDSVTDFKFITDCLGVLVHLGLLPLGGLLVVLVDCLRQELVVVLFAHQIVVGALVGGNEDFVAAFNHFHFPVKFVQEVRLDVPPVPVLHLLD